MSSYVNVWRFGFRWIPGSRDEKLPLSIDENSGDVIISIDTGTLKNGPTTFFEFVRED